MAQTNVTADAAVRLMLKFPMISELYYSMAVIEDTTVPTLATDGRSMWVNPGFWKTLSLDLKISALAHEVGHKMLLHCSRRGHRHPQLWNIAADYVVNGILKQNGMAIDAGWIQPLDKYIGWSVDAVYSDLMQQLKDNPQPGSGSGSGQGGEGEEQDGEGGDGQGDEQDGPGVPQSVKGKAWDDIKQVTGSPEEIEKYEAEVMTSVNKALMTAKAMGKVPVGMDDFDDVFRATEEPWFNHLSRFMQALSVSEYNWARTNKRTAAVHGFFSPNVYSEALGEVVVAIDCSGSVYGPAEQAGFAGHVNAILSEAKPSKVHVLYFDSQIQRHEELDPGEMDFRTRPKGGGGTAFEPIWEWVENFGADPVVCIVLTDTYGSFGEEPEYPVIWASIARDVNVPWGEVIYVE